MVPVWTRADEVNLTRRVGAVTVAGWPGAAHIRARAYDRPACPWDEHRWVRFMDDETVVLLLCAECGRWPLETLETLNEPIVGSMAET